MLSFPFIYWTSWLNSFFSPLLFNIPCPRDPGKRLFHFPFTSGPAPFLESRHIPRPTPTLRDHRIVSGARSVDDPAFHWHHPPAQDHGATPDPTVCTTPSVHTATITYQTLYFGRTEKAHDADCPRAPIPASGTVRIGVPVVNRIRQHGKTTRASSLDRGINLATSDLCIISPQRLPTETQEQSVRTGAYSTCRPRSSRDRAGPMSQSPSPIGHPGKSVHPRKRETPRLQRHRVHSTPGPSMYSTAASP